MWQAIFFGGRGGAGVGGQERYGAIYPKGPIEKQKEVKNYLILFLGVNMIF
jgi:hypothetical protein